MANKRLCLATVKRYLIVDIRAKSLNLFSATVNILIPFNSTGLNCPTQPVSISDRFGCPGFPNNSPGAHPILPRCAVRRCAFMQDRAGVKSPQAYTCHLHKTASPAIPTARIRFLFLAVGLRYSSVGMLISIRGGGVLIKPLCTLLRDCHSPIRVASWYNENIVFVVSYLSSQTMHTAGRDQCATHNTRSYPTTYRL